MSVVPQCLTSPGQRLDQWLWCARFAKSRTLAQTLIYGGKVRVNRIKAGKPSHWLKAGDVVTLSLGPRVRVIEVKGFHPKRRSAPEAAALFLELTPAKDRTTSQPGHGDAQDRLPGVATDRQESAPQAFRAAGSCRTTKQERRTIDRLKGRFAGG